MRVEVHVGGRRTVVELDYGLKLSSALGRAGISLNVRCGEEGHCEGCLVEIDGRLVRACQEMVGARQVRIPARSLLHRKGQVVSSYRLGVIPGCAPLLDSELGAAIDVGTTTVAIQTVDLSEGSVLATETAFNRQAQMGDDVLTRINLCRTSETGVADFNRLLLETLSEHSTLLDVDGFCVAGNATMAHLLLGEDPGSMGVSPFTPAFEGPRVSELFGKPLYVLPAVSAYVGGDIVAGLISTGMYQEDGPSLLVDVGTNGEIVLKDGDRFFGCATAAGPAFEGSGLTSGCRATDGAITHIRPGLETEKLGKGRAIGMCGSAYVDFMAVGRAEGWMSSMGRFESPKEVAKGVSVTEGDVASLLQAKAAIAAGIEVLLAQAGLEASDLETVHLAGGFGLHMDLANAIAIGLLPGFSLDQVRLAGNSSLGGAYLAMVDRSYWELAARLAEEVETVELNQDPGFEDAYLDNLELR